MNPQYLGDGVYVMVEYVMPIGPVLKLCTGSHDNPDQIIILEPEVYKALVGYVANLKTRKEESVT